MRIVSLVIIFVFSLAAEAQVPEVSNRQIVISPDSFLALDFSWEQPTPATPGDLTGYFLRISERLPTSILRMVNQSSTQRFGTSGCPPRPRVPVVSCTLTVVANVNYVAEISAQLASINFTSFRTFSPRPIMGAARPSAPDNLSFTDRSALTVTISWEEPAVEDSRLVRTGYELSITDSAGADVSGLTGTCTSTLAASAVECELVGLSAASANLSLVAVYSQGFSTAAIASIPAVGTAPIAAPTGITVVPGNSQITVSWTEVQTANNGGSNITGYRIVATPTSGSATEVTAGVGSSHVLSGLARATAYEVTVAAVNAVGTGPASSASSATTLAATAPIAAPDRHCLGSGP